MKVYIEAKDKWIKAKAPSVGALLKKLDVNPVTVLVVKNGALVADDARLSAKDEVKILSVVSGG